MGTGSVRGSQLVDDEVDGGTGSMEFYVRAAMIHKGWATLGMGMRPETNRLRSETGTPAATASGLRAARGRSHGAAPGQAEAQTRLRVAVPSACRSAAHS